MSAGGSGLQPEIQFDLIGPVGGMGAAREQFAAIALDHAPRGVIVLVAEDGEAVEAFLCCDRPAEG